MRAARSSPWGAWLLVKLKDLVDWRFGVQARDPLFHHVRLLPDQPKIEHAFSPIFGRSLIVTGSIRLTR
jgi:hypothetical protein